MPRKNRPFTMHNEKDMNVPTLERIFQHFDDQFRELYDTLAIIVLGSGSGGGGGVSGITTFDGLNNTPANKSGKALHIVRVNSGETALEFVAPGSGGGLDADTLDGLDSLDFIKKDGSVALTANWDAGSFKITAQQLESDIANFQGNVEIDGDLNHDGSKIGLFTTAPTTKQTVTGSRGGNAALASLLTALAAYGLITDSSTA